MTDQNTITDTAHEILEKIDAAWPYPLVRRIDMAKFSCGLISIKTLEKSDSLGKGIPNSIKINGKIVYTKIDALVWIKGRIQKQAIKTHKINSKNKILLEERQD
jgi:hypothetical protein